ncbi:methyltransferase type 11 [Niveomyces insectorum RCEF 264]|uniref:Methyltransferase type 11 n=1 Tax=Niveomyces insectorum RCEF 264 TaxID=1081102 RepID=A0A167TBF1_9HYPO|nr:methyltransferase type 11 [Niveomyces insectorum RCEF 264]
MADINDAALAAWSANAADWDAAMGFDGNQYWRALERPRRLLRCKQVLPERLAGSGAGPGSRRTLTPTSGVRALDLGTGNGLTARWLAAARGPQRGRPGAAHGPAHHVLRRAGPDAGRRLCAPFDVVLANMVLMDIPTLEPLAAALPGLLADDGVFVASLLHPVFFTSRARRTLEVVQDYDLEDGPQDNTDKDHTDNATATASSYVHGYKLTQYLHVPPFRGFAVAGQARAQHYFHRPLHELLGTFLGRTDGRGGRIVLDALEEPAFTPEQVAAATAGKPTNAASSLHYTQFPPLLVFRLRKVGPERRHT